ncbi:PREDICTED: PRUPE_3G214300 [Prunus dulcis]|uniref:PREDICTED: PRUPE_3G214300 n=1 Tax=Prunus dulcis TaxID=3755 RepID=A0A5E4G0Z6_PRUDU|nr:PREDICTED: PRUPE_3G214300 [Prunus dulcis]
MDTLDQLRNRRRMGPERRLRGIGVRKVSSTASSKKKIKSHGYLGSVEKPKAHGSERRLRGIRVRKLRNRWRMGLEGRLRGIGVRKVCSIARAKKKKKRVMDTLDQLRNLGRMGPEGWLRGIGVRKVSSSSSAKTLT